MVGGDDSRAKWLRRRTGAARAFPPELCRLSYRETETGVSTPGLRRIDQAIWHKMGGFALDAPETAY
jgi:hypothetical protein